MDNDYQSLDIVKVPMRWNETNSRVLLFSMKLNKLGFCSGTIGAIWIGETEGERPGERNEKPRSEILRV